MLCNSRSQMLRNYSARFFSTRGGTLVLLAICFGTGGWSRGFSRAMIRSFTPVLCPAGCGRDVILAFAFLVIRTSKLRLASQIIHRLCECACKSNILKTQFHV